MRAGRRLVGAAAAVLVTVMLLAGPGPAEAASAAAPFRATATAQIAFTGETTLAWSGSGLATQLGALAGAVGSIVLTGPDDSCPGGIANTNTATLTAANGDSLTLTSTDVTCPVSASQFDGSGHFTVTGGTGRFARATGRGSVVGHADLAAAAFTIEWTGSLTL